MFFSLKWMAKAEEPTHSIVQMSESREWTRLAYLVNGIWYLVKRVFCKREGLIASWLVKRVLLVKEVSIHYEFKFLKALGMHFLKCDDSEACVTLTVHFLLHTKLCAPWKGCHLNLATKLKQMMTWLNKKTATT